MPASLSGWLVGGVAAAAFFLASLVNLRCDSPVGERGEVREKGEILFRELGTIRIRLLPLFSVSYAGF